MKILLADYPVRERAEVVELTGKIRRALRRWWFNERGNGEAVVSVGTGAAGTLGLFIRVRRALVDDRPGLAMVAFRYRFGDRLVRQLWRGTLTALEGVF